MELGRENFIVLSYAIFASDQTFILRSEMSLIVLTNYAHKKTSKQVAGFLQSR